jgi:hypothetical protein
MLHFTPNSSIGRQIDALPSSLSDTLLWLLTGISGKGKGRKIRIAMENFYHCSNKLLNITELFLFKMYSLYYLHRWHPKN